VPKQTTLPLIMMAILSHNYSASSILCVVRIIELFLSYLTILNRLLRETGSTPDVGSSRNSILGDTNSVKAQESLRLLPPDKLVALVFMNSSRSKVYMIRFTLFSNSAEVRPFTRAIYYKFSRTVS